MERNWLIRTSQNQILGPVAKQKLLEFIQKGALGMLDEVSSGNGYWFSLKEKDLIEKYLHGDLPQGYNPISESRSVLSKKDNPDKTTSINTAPANNANPTEPTSNNITQIIKLDFETLKAAVPKASDLELPDLDFSANKSPVVTAATETTKLPNQDDLEFPDVDLIASSVSASFNGGDVALQASLTSAKIPMPIPKPAHAVSVAPTVSAEDMVLPREEDLAFPDMDDLKTSPKIDKGMVDLSHQYTRTVALDTQQASVVLPIEEEDDGDNLSFEVTTIIKTHAPVEEEVAKAFEQANKENIAAANAETPLKLNTVRNRGGIEIEDKKLLHDRKPKSSVSKGAALRDPTRENHPKDANAVPQKRNDNYIFFILIILVLIIVAVFFYFKEILNKPLPM